MVLKVEKLCKSYGKKKVLEDVSFHIDQPEIVVVVGNNGSGKTTLFNTLMGYLPHNSGSIEICGKKCGAVDKIILTDEKNSYFNSGKLIKVIDEHAYIDKEFDKEKCLNILKKFRLDTANRYSKMSKGMKNQFNIAIGLASNKQITLLDEPSSGLDEISRYNFQNIINNEFMDNPRIFLISTHLLGELENIATKLLIVKDDGSCVYDSVDAIQKNYVRINGTAEDIDQLTQERWVRDKKSLGTFTSCVIINNLSYYDKRFIESKKISVNYMSLNEICRIICNEELFEVGND